jgi:Uma2 family endonuclease
MSNHTTPPAEEPVGRRQTITYNVTGQPSYERHPLAPADFLDPQPGDEFFHGERHDRWVRRLLSIFRHLYRYSPFVTMLSGAKVIWPNSPAFGPAPDLTIVTNLPDPNRHRAVLDLASEGATVRCIVEVTSPRLAQLDLSDKVEHYARCGVQEYVIVDLGGHVTHPTATPRVLVYHLKGDGFSIVEPDADGRVFSVANKVWLQVEADDRLTVIETRTNRPIMPPPDTDEPDAAVQVDAAFRAQSIASRLGFSG